MLNAGRLRHRLRLEQPVTVQDATGTLTTTWQEVKTIHAAIEPLSVKDYLVAQQIKSKITARIVIRFDPAINPTMRLVCPVTGTVYQIHGALPDPVSGREYLTLAASC